MIHKRILNVAGKVFNELHACMERVREINLDKAGKCVILRARKFR